MEFISTLAEEAHEDALDLVFGFIKFSYYAPNPKYY